MHLLFLVIICFLAADCSAADFGVPENALNEFRSIKYENIYTKVPTSGKLVSIRITDGGKTFFVCKEKSGYAIYNLEVRPIAGLKEKMEQEVKDYIKKWDNLLPDELLLTKERNDAELNKKLQKYCEAVWVRNEIIIEEPQQ